MFKDEIKHLLNINERLVVSEGLSSEAFNALPENKKVRIFEADELLKKIEKKIRDNFSEVVQARYDLIWELHRLENHEKKFSEVRRILNTNERIISLLKELDEQVNDEAEVAKPKESTVYFSYAWGDSKEITEKSREKFIDDLYFSLRTSGFEVSRDKMNIEYGGLISRFMEDIGKGDLIVVGISDKYLKSTYCMWELCEIHRNSMLEKSTFSKRILPVRIENIELTNPQILREYLRYWQEKYDEYIEFLNEFPQQIGEQQLLEFKKIRTIKDRFAELIGLLQDLNAKTLSILQNNSFEEIKTTIINRLNKKE